jgi:hypothetical protein
MLGKYRIKDQLVQTVTNSVCEANVLQEETYLCVAS